MGQTSLKATARLAALLALGTGLSCKGASSGKQETTPTNPDATQLDPAHVCRQACTSLVACVPELAEADDGDPKELAARVGQDCEQGCANYSDPQAAAVLHDCQGLAGRCTAYHACVTAPSNASFFAAVAPAKTRSCDALCERATQCLGPVCDAEEDQECKGDGGRGPEELQAHCLGKCRASAALPRSQDQLLGCLDHAACEGLLSCLDGWSDTRTRELNEVAPTVSPVCQTQCDRAVTCGSEEEQLDSQENQAMREAMVDTWIECALECEARRERGAKIEACNSETQCESFFACLDKL